MVDSLIAVNADELSRAYVDPDGVVALGLERVHVSLAGEARCNGDEEAGAEWRCHGCGEALDEEGLGIEYGGDECHGTHPESHEPERVALSWANSAAITLNEGDDSIDVSISVGDPRGAFTVTIRRLQNGDLIMHTPHPDEPCGHAELNELHPGTYRIGG